MVVIRKGARFERGAQAFRVEDQEYERQEEMKSVSSFLCGLWREAWDAFKREKWNALAGVVLFLVMVLVARAL